MENEKYDNKVSDGVVAIIGTIVRTAERAIVVFWTGLRSTTVHGTPSLVGFVAAIAPVLAPLPLATQTAFSLTTYMDWYAWQAVVMAIVIEAAGFPLWVFLTETILRDGWKKTAMLFTLGGAVVVYQITLILINVSLAVNDGARGTTAWILFLACLFPALCAIAFGYSNSQNKATIERERREALEQKERERQERREDRKQAAELRLKYAKDTPGVELEDAPGKGKFRGGKPS